VNGDLLNICSSLSLLGDKHHLHSLMFLTFFDQALARLRHHHVCIVWPSNPKRVFLSFFAIHIHSPILFDLFSNFCLIMGKLLKMDGL
jgi:hypothetical protein